MPGTANCGRGRWDVLPPGIHPQRKTQRHTDFRFGGLFPPRGRPAAFAGDPRSFDLRNNAGKLPGWAGPDRVLRFLAAIAGAFADRRLARFSRHSVASQLLYLGAGALALGPGRSPPLGGSGDRFSPRRGSAIYDRGCPGSVVRGGVTGAFGLLKRPARTVPGRVRRSEFSAMGGPVGVCSIRGRRAFHLPPSLWIRLFSLAGAIWRSRGCPAGGPTRGPAQAQRRPSGRGSRGKVRPDLKEKGLGADRVPRGQKPRLRQAVCLGGKWAEINWGAWTVNGGDGRAGPLKLQKKNMGGGTSPPFISPLLPGPWNDVKGRHFDKA